MDLRLQKKNCLQKHHKRWVRFELGPHWSKIHCLALTAINTCKLHANFSNTLQCVCCVYNERDGNIVEVWVRRPTRPRRRHTIAGDLRGCGVRSVSRPLTHTNAWTLARAFTAIQSLACPCTCRPLPYLSLLLKWYSQ